MSEPSHLARTSTVMLSKFDGSSENESKEEASSNQLSPAASQMKQPSDKRAPESHREQDSASDSSNGISAGYLSDEQTAKQCNDNDSPGNENLLSKNEETAGKLFEREINHKIDTNKLREAQAQEQLQKDTNEFRDDIPGNKNISEAPEQITMDIIQEASDNNNSSNSEIGHNGVNGCIPSDDICNEQEKDHLSGEQQATQDSDLSPSHSSISAKTNNDNDDAIRDHEQLNSSTLGRNRRVRQKNRYFNDFHCMQLVKGCRSRDDYGAYSPSTSATRSSNRRSTTDSSRNSPDAAIQSNGKTQPKMISFKDLFHDKYCRKCGMVKPHDEHNKCQICLYNEIIGAEKRRKASLRSSSKSKSKNKSPGHKTPTKQEQSAQSQPQAEVSQKPPESKLELNHGKSLDGLQQTVSSITIKQEQATKGQTSDSQKRKWVVKPGKSASDDNVISICREIDSSNHDDSGKRETNDEPKRKVMIINSLADFFDCGNTRSSGSSDSTPAPSSKSIDTNAINNAGQNDVDNQASNSSNIKPDAWTPEQVAQYVLSKGFVSESNLFREQDVDGISLLMMKRQDFTYGLKMKLGPALKLYEQVCRLRRDYDQEATIAS